MSEANPNDKPVFEDGTPPAPHTQTELENLRDAYLIPSADTTPANEHAHETLETFTAGIATANTREALETMLRGVCIPRRRS